MKYDIHKIVRARTLKGLTQTELARRIGKDSSTISKFESGDLNPLPPTMKRIADELGLNMEDLIIDDTERATA